MANERKLIVQVVGDDSGLQKTLANSAKSIEKFGRDTTRTTGGGVSTAATFEPTLEKIRESQAEAQQLRQRLEGIGDESLATGKKLATAAKFGAGFFAAGEALSGAAAGIEALAGESTPATRKLGDLGDAMGQVLRLNVAGFFQALGAESQRAREALDKYAGSLDDANEASEALAVAQATRDLGFGRQADRIAAQANKLIAAAEGLKALEFGQRQENVATLNGQTSLVRFRGAGPDSLGGRRGLGGAGGVAIERASQQPIVINNTTVVDGETVAQSSRKYDEQHERRNPRQKRGPNSAFR